ncbi:aminotransferase class I/II-fold pyridoxal phosphate-dependent enzyme [Bradyrhizobium sp. LMTR 3]|uniref:pyridoxal phosphate-dependent aminotransferase n=1 Tax=Bradyrhizobium sp. LMTR 3 TaxID=189873 RepID=UPI000A73F976
MEIIDLTAGEMWSDLAPSVREGAIAAINRNVNRYTDTLGLMELRHALARRISTETAQPWSADEIAVTSGAKQALFNAAMVILNPGDEVLIPAPYWTTFPAQIVIAGGTPVFIGTRHSNYVPTLTDLVKAVTSRTKAIVVNTPNNPTGAIYDRESLAGIAQLAMDRDLWIIFDECYGAFAHAPHTHNPIVSVAPQARDRTLIVNSFSKSLALTGWRIGYLAGPKAVIGAVKALQSQTTSNPNVIAQHALLHYLECGGPAYQLQLQRQVANPRALRLSMLSTLTSVPQPTAQGGFYFYLDLSELQRHAKAHGRENVADGRWCCNSFGHSLWRPRWGSTLLWHQSRIARQSLAASDRNSERTDLLSGKVPAFKEVTIMPDIPSHAVTLAAGTRLPPAVSDRDPTKAAIRSAWHADLAQHTRQFGRSCVPGSTFRSAAKRCLKGQPTTSKHVACASRRRAISGTAFETPQVSPLPRIVSETLETFPRQQVAILTVRERRCGKSCDDERG